MFANPVSRDLHTRWLGRDTRVHDVLDSTQDEARRLAAAGGEHGLVVWAHEQTAGRGRVDRRWHSAAGSGLWFSLLLRPALEPAAAPFLALLAGVAMADALRRQSRADVRLKWPNDLLVDGRKVGGILVEASLAANRVEWVVVGVGVNLRTPPSGFPAAVRDTAAALYGAETTFDARRVLGACLRSLERRYEQLLRDGPEPARRRWLRLSDTVGRDVSADVGAGTIRGRAVDLAPDGSLVLETPEGPVRVSAGEVVHLR